MSATDRFAPFVFLACSALSAQSGPPPIPTELRARFGFLGPLVVKVGDGLNNLQIADTDGDGRLEAVAADARRARLVAITVRGQETTLRSLPTHGQIGGYTVADVTGDGKAELLLADARGRLTVRTPGGEASGAPIDLGLPGRGFSMLPGDLDGDGAADLVVIGKAALRQVTGLGGTAKLSPIEPFEENAWSYRLADVDGDKRLDLMAVVEKNMNLRLRHGRGDGTFGPWRIFSIDELYDVFPSKTADGAPALATIAGQNRAVSLRAFGTGGGDGGQSLDWWALGENSSGKTLPWALGDVDGDGDEDLLIARADRAQLAVYEWRDDTFVMRAVPTLAGVAGVAIGDVDRDGKQDVLLVSPEEDAVAWMSGAKALDVFPERLAIMDKPVAAAVHPEGGVIVLARSEKRDAVLLRCAPGMEPGRLVELGRLPGDPTRLFAGDFGDGPGLEVAFVVPGEGLRAVSLDAPPAAKPDKKDTKDGKAAESAGFTKKLDDGAIGITQHDGRPALVAVRERFVRTFRLDDKGQVHVLAQDNGPDGMVELALAADVGGSRCYLDKKSNKLARVTKDGQIATVDVPAFDFTNLADHRGAALLLSARGVLRVPFTAGPSLRTLATHEPPITRTSYWTGRSGDFDHDGVTDLVVVDRHLPGVQILAGGKDGLVRALAVPVFETGPSEDPDHEPHDLDVGDLDGDGRADFVLLAHDRILIYLQEP